MRNAARQVNEDATGVNGPLTRTQIIDRAADQLVDYVYEGLLDSWGIDYGTVINGDVYRAIQRIAACAMLAQHEVDEEFWSIVAAAAATTGTEASPE